MIALLLMACSPAPPPLACNGSPDLCARRVDQVVFAATHNSMSNADEGWLAPNQQHGLARQLDDGVRGFLLDVHDHEGEPWLCHGTCSLGGEPLVAGLGKLAAFLQEHPAEVLILIFESYVPAAAVAAAFDASGLEPLAYAHPGGAWPTLGALVDAGTPVLAFSQDPEDGPAWLMHFYGEGWDNDYRARTPDEMSCELLRGSREHPLFLLNHFLTAPIGTAELAAQVNVDPFLWDRIQRCMDESGDLPNLVAVDFYDIGDLLGAVDRLNAGEAAP